MLKWNFTIMASKLTKRTPLKFDITKIAQCILYMLDKDVRHLNDRKLCIMLFLMDYSHNKEHGSVIFGDEYIKANRNPRPQILTEIFNIIANGEDLDEEDERLYIIQELLDYLDIEILEKDGFTELQFIKMEESFDSDILEQSEMKTLRSVVSEFKETTPRNIANTTFKIEEVRQTAKDEVIL